VDKPLDFELDKDGNVARKRCRRPSCREMFPVEEFPRDRRNKDGYGSICRFCRTKDMRKWRKGHLARIEKNREAVIKEHGEEYFEKQKREWEESRPWRRWSIRTRERLYSSGLDVSKITRAEIEGIGSAAEVCGICNQRLDWTDSTAAKKGPDTPILDLPYSDTVVESERVWVICRGCYTAKGGRTLQEYVAYCMGISDRFSEWLHGISTPEDD